MAWRCHDLTPRFPHAGAPQAQFQAQVGLEAPLTRRAAMCSFSTSSDRRWAVSAVACSSRFARAVGERPRGPHAAALTRAHCTRQRRQLFKKEDDLELNSCTAKESSEILMYRVVWAICGVMILYGVTKSISLPAACQRGHARRRLQLVTGQNTE